MKINDPDEFTEFVWGYIDAAIWTCSDELGIDLGSGACDDYIVQFRAELSEEAHATMRGHCADFLASLRPDSLREWEPAQAGHDFWLTRNGHGAGFWDRGHVEGDYLSKWASTYGECSLWRPMRPPTDEEIEDHARGNVVMGWRPMEGDDTDEDPLVPDEDKPIEVE